MPFWDADKGPPMIDWNTLSLDTVVECEFHTHTGRFCLPEHDYNDPVLGYIKNNGMWDDYVINYCAPFIEPGSTVIDVGANFGQMSLQWSKMVGPTGRVHAFECSPFVSYFLKRTLALNDHASNVVVHTEAAWHEAGVELELLKPDGTPRGQFFSGMGIKGTDGLDPREMATHRVISTTLDSFEYENRVSVIKVDAQGSDYFVLRGAENTIRKHRPMITFEYETEYDDIFHINFDMVDQWLMGLGYIQRPDIFNNRHDFVYTYNA